MNQYGELIFQEFFVVAKMIILYSTRDVEFDLT